jgi:hypothetical protein
MPPTKSKTIITHCSIEVSGSLSTAGGGLVGAMGAAVGAAVGDTEVGVTAGVSRAATLVGSADSGVDVGSSVGTSAPGALVTVAGGAGGLSRTMATNSCKISSVLGIDQTAIPSISLATAWIAVYISSAVPRVAPTWTKTWMSGFARWPTSAIPRTQAAND